jgi:hypothetical protein
MTIIQCHRDQGSRSRRAGTDVVAVPVDAGTEAGCGDDAVVMAPSPSSDPLPDARDLGDHARRNRGRSLPSG